MPYLGEVYIDVITNESISESTTTTDHALEDGEQATDHAENDPITLSISGAMIDPSDEKMLKLRQYREERKVLTYRYRGQLETVLITSFNSVKSSIDADGYSFTMTLKQIRIVKAPNVIRVSVPVKRQVKAVTRAGKKSVKNASSSKSKKEVTSRPPTSAARRLAT